MFKFYVAFICGGIILGMKQEIRYYSDEVHDDFAQTNIDAVPLPAGFKYHSDNIFRRLRSFFIYRILATPACFCPTKVAVFTAMIPGVHWPMA